MCDALKVASLCYTNLFSILDPTQSLRCHITSSRNLFPNADLQLFYIKECQPFKFKFRKPQVCCSLTQCIYLRDRSQGKSCDFTFILFNASYVNFTALKKKTI